MKNERYRTEMRTDKEERELQRLAKKLPFEDIAYVMKLKACITGTEYFHSVAMNETAGIPTFDLMFINNDAKKKQKVFKGHSKD